VGLRGVPVAAFAVGGIPEWLTDGVNGHLAPGDPPTSAGLARAIAKCLESPLNYERLRRGALEMARQFTGGGHLAALSEIFAKARLNPGGAKGV
jgi:glycosyltransferase involved in cell wall biosynthesis